MPLSEKTPRSICDHLESKANEVVDHNSQRKNDLSQRIKTKIHSIRDNWESESNLINESDLQEWKELSIEVTLENEANWVRSIKMPIAWFVMLSQKFSWKSMSKTCKKRRTLWKSCEFRSEVKDAWLPWKKMPRAWFEGMGKWNEMKSMSKICIRKSTVHKSVQVRQVNECKLYRFAKMALA
jgi:hypothetical protein